MKTLHQGKFLTLIDDDGWEYVKRANSKGVVVILAKTDDDKILFTEQYRVPIGKRVIEFPAGLVGDGEVPGESLESAAGRELFEETGYRAKKLEHLLTGPVSSGLSAEQLSIYYAYDLVKEGPGGGDETENITIHEIPLEKAHYWLWDIKRSGCVVDPKVYSGLYFFRHGLKPAS